MKLLASLNPIQIALLIVAGLATLGVIITLVRSLMTFAGFGEVSAAAKQVARAISGEAFRDGPDLVVSGKYDGSPVVARFSNQEHTPGLNLRMAAPATFQLSVAHVSKPITEGGKNQVRTGNPRFDARFTMQTDRVTEANMFLNASVAGRLQQLACSNNTFVSIGSGAIEVSELLIPPNTGQHVMEHVQAMAELVREVRKMPGADRVKLVSIAPERQVAGRIAIAIGVVLAVVSIFAATKVPSHPAFKEVNATLQNGIPPSDGLLLHDAEQWHVATPDDLDPAAAAWLRNQGRTPAGRIEADFSGKGEGTDVGYLLIGPEGRRRIVMLANHANVLDGEMVNVAVIAAIPKYAVPRIQWKGGMPPEDTLGDGLLVLQKKGDGQTSVIFFLSRSGIVTGAPIDYQQINLQ
jgi:hypothetical protein